MAIFNSYVSLPEGRWTSETCHWCRCFSVLQCPGHLLPQCPAVIGWGQDPCNGKYDQYWPMTNDPSKISCTYLLFWWIIMDYISRAAVTINAVLSFCPVQIHETKIYQWPQWAHGCLASLGRSLKSKCNAWLVTWNAEIQWGRDFL